VKPLRPKPHGGKREGAGRPPLTKKRCACGKHTLARAIRLRLRCAKVGREMEQRYRFNLRSGP
jgi:hypothetical protein